ncbi:MAG: hypothetical protein H2040_10715 [Euryhalocaulis sp.]|uniref:hypothetical protein n=1 Tax=Euryhalocaulis sp. TaxID=2744307 RepID=UPI0017AC821D|nr:hypothetical protein [Euryhalocaulis sp.]MBA4802323.1 hypothetical protein [Euryhalocaulis sp.]
MPELVTIFPRRLAGPRAFVCAAALLGAALAGALAALETRASLLHGAPPVETVPANPPRLHTASLADILADRAAWAGDRESAARLSMATLRRRPTDAGAWARLAYLERAANGMSEDAALYLERSFLSAPFGDAGLRRWRIGFTLENWMAVHPDTRLAVQRSLEAELLTPRGRRWFRGYAREISNPQGRAAAGAFLSAAPD